MAGRVSIELVLSIFIAVVSLNGAIETCPRNSPEEIWYSDISPLVNLTLEEFRVFYGIVFGSLHDGNLFNFLPYLKQDAEKAANLTDKFEVMEEKVFALVERAYDVMERSWLDLGEVGRQLSKENTKSQEKAVMDKMEALRRAHVKSSKIILRSTANEISTFFRHAIELVIEDVTQLLEAELEEAPQTAKEVAELVQSKIEKINPQDLLGKVVRRFIGRSLGNVFSRTGEAQTILRQTLERIDKLTEDFKQTFNKEPLTATSWANFWRRALEDSVQETKKREEMGKEDFHLIYKNEVYLCEVLMDTIVLF